MKKQDKSYLTLGLFVIFIISLCWASWQIKEGFKEGKGKGKGKRAERRAAKRAERAKAADPMWREWKAASDAQRISSKSGPDGPRMQRMEYNPREQMVLSGDTPQLMRVDTEQNLSPAMKFLYSQQYSSDQ
jgi:hypothetical protein